MRKLKLPSIKEVREALSYDPNTGEFFWRWRPSRETSWNARYAGCRAGHWNKSLGYLLINLNRWPIPAHRIAWAYMTGKWSKKTIDHANCNRKDNRWCNLREATRLQQTQNRSQHRRSERTGLPKGVDPHYGKFKATIRINRKGIHLGTFGTPEEAYAAWYAAAQKEHGKFFNPS